MLMEIPKPQVVIREGKRAQLTRSRKYHRCGICQEYIYKGTDYYAIANTGGYLESIKFPQKVHPKCLEKYFEKIKSSLS